jgi:protease-4
MGLGRCAQLAAGIVRLMAPRDLLRNTVLRTRNWLRSLRRRGLDCIVLTLHGSFPELSPQREPLPFPLSRLSLFPTQVSLADMRTVMEVIGDDSRVQTVVLRFDTLQAGLSTFHSLRRIFIDLRAKGKRLIAWLPTASTMDYYLASACDEIVVPPSGHLYVMGVQIEPLFLKDTLAMIGVEADLESIAEYKTAPDTFRRSTISEPHREMLETIADSFFDEIVGAIAEGRGFDTAHVRGLIDRMPIAAAEAVEAGLIDAVLYEDELSAHISQVERTRSKDNTVAASLLTWREAARWLRTPIKRTTRQRIGVVSVQGMLVPGRSRRIPVPIPIPLPFVEEQAGAETIAQALRQTEADKHIVAVILSVDTPGGSMVASDLIWREVSRLRERKPVVVLMGRQAASGGYYISAPANHIIARPTTLTGSIGIWGGKFSFAGLYERLGVGRAAIGRGAMSGIFSEAVPFSDEERTRIYQSLSEGYTLFKTRVAGGRGMTDAQVEEIARGRVWTGAQACEKGLVDELGGFELALARAKELAGLEAEREYMVVQVRPPRHTLLPPPFGGETATDSSLGAMLDAARNLTRERIWALAPWTVRTLA